MYFIILIIGGVGYVAIVASGSLHGLGHGAHAGSGSHHAGGPSPSATHVGGAHSAGGHGTSHAAQVAQHAAHDGAMHHHSGTSRSGGSASRLLSTLSVFSPLSIFTAMVGVGAVGMFLESRLSQGHLLMVAITGGLVFNFLMIRPLMGLMMRFASNPIEGLEGAVAHEAEATNNFDAIGRGVVRMTLDGESVRLLATLNDSERESGIRIKRGDKVLVLEVDPHSNSCRVTKELAGNDV